MPTQYLDTFRGVADGTLIPNAKADGRQSGAKESVTFGSKLAADGAWAAADVIYACRLRAGEQLVSATGNTDTTLGTTTLSLGTLANPTKYVNAALLTAINVPTALGPKTAAAVAGPITADEDLYWTLGVGGIATNINLQLLYRFTSIK